MRPWRSADCCTEESCRPAGTLEADGGENQAPKSRSKDRNLPAAGRSWKEAHNFAKTPLELHVGLALVMDAGFAVLASQRKLVVHWKSGSRINRSTCERVALAAQPGDKRGIRRGGTYTRSCARRRRRIWASCSSGP